MNTCNNAIVFGEGEAYEEIVARLRGRDHTVRACGTEIVNVVDLAAGAIFLTTQEKDERLQFMEQNHRGRRRRKGGGMLGLEPEVAPFVDRINKNNDICTVESCWGHNGEKDAYLSLRCTKGKFALLCGLIEKFISWDEVRYVQIQHTNPKCKPWFSIVWDGKKFEDPAERITKILEVL